MAFIADRARLSPIERNRIPKTGQRFAVLIRSCSSRTWTATLIRTRTMVFEAPCEAPCQTPTDGPGVDREQAAAFQRLAERHLDASVPSQEWLDNA